MSKESNFNRNFEKQGFKRKPHNSKYDFYTHCIACDTRLNDSYTSYGYCGDCSRVINRCKTQELVDEDNRYVRDQMWRNPLGAIEEDVFPILDENYDDYD